MSGGPRIREFSASRSKVEAALRWLVAHSPAYDGVVISQANLDRIRDGQQAFRTFSLEELDSEEHGGDQGPAPGQCKSSAGLNEEHLWEESACIGVTGSAGALLAYEEGLHKISGGGNGVEGRGDERDAVPHSDFHQMFAPPLRWEQTKFFFAKAWPTLFMPLTYTEADGTIVSDVPADFNRVKPRVENPKLPEYIKWLITAQGGRYARHPGLKFALKSMKESASVNGSTSFGLKQMPTEVPLNASDLRQLVIGA